MPKKPSLICRGKNLHLSTIKQFLYALPQEDMPKDQFDAYAEQRMNGFITTHSQIARQLALYYIDSNNICHPRFKKKLSNKEIMEYMEYWARRYFVPNPYTPSFDDEFKPKNIYAYLYNHRNDGLTLEDSLNSMFNTEVNEVDKAKSYLLQFTDIIVDSDGTFIFPEGTNLPIDVDLDRNDKVGYYNYFGNIELDMADSQSMINGSINNKYRPFITAIKSKPFLLLAGISGTGKSRIVRELARSCWPADSVEYKAQKPSNFEMVQVKPNWHDSSELIGYVSRINGVKFIVGPFLKFMVRALNDPKTPYFLCLDEMNLAPVEQYFAEFLSVIESRKADENGHVITDPIIDYSNTEEYKSLVDQLFPNDDQVRAQYLTENKGKRLRIPQNLIVIGTVNMDETTFSFSRKVLDRAMTIEMNEVDLRGGLAGKFEPIGKLGEAELIGRAVEGVDIYAANQVVCDTAIDYLQAINDRLEGTPFKVAYRTRNEFLLYVVNNLPYNKDKNGKEIEQDFVIARALDEITSMKVLSRIEGDESKVSKSFLEGLKSTIKTQLEAIATNDEFVAKINVEATEGEKRQNQSISLAKLDEMISRLESGYTSFWS